jgi:hypothetical protein
MGGCVSSSKTGKAAPSSSPPANPSSPAPPSKTQQSPPKRQPTLPLIRGALPSTAPLQFSFSYPPTWSVTEHGGPGGGQGGGRGAAQGGGRHGGQHGEQNEGRHDGDHGRGQGGVPGEDEDEGGEGQQQQQQQQMMEPPQPIGFTLGDLIHNTFRVRVTLAPLPANTSLSDFVEVSIAALSEMGKYLAEEADVAIAGRPARTGVVRRTGEYENSMLVSPISWVVVDGHVGVTFTLAAKDVAILQRVRPEFNDLCLSFRTFPAEHARGPQD